MGTIIIIIVGVYFLLLILNFLFASNEPSAKQKEKDYSNWFDLAKKASKTNIKLAISNYDRAISSKGTSTAYNNRALLKSEDGNYNGALADYDRAIQLEPNDALLYYNRGICKWNKDFEDLALLDFEKAASMGNEDAKKMIADNYDYEKFFVTDCYIDEKNVSHVVLRNNEGQYIFGEREAVPCILDERINMDRSLLKDFDLYDDSNYSERYVKFLAAKEKSEKVIKDRQVENKFFAFYGIDYFYHMTHISNLESILINGLQSNNTVKSESITFNDISDNQVNDRRNRLEPVHNKSVHDYVPLYFNPKNPMLYVRKNIQHDIVILGINRKLLFNKNNVFTDGNASANKTKFFNDILEINTLNWKCIRDEYWHDHEDGKRQRCAELLVYPQINASDIQVIFASDIHTVRKVTDIIGKENKIKCELKSDLFFV